MKFFRRRYIRRKPDDIMNYSRDLDYAALDQGAKEILVLIILLVIGVCVYAICN